MATVEWTDERLNDAFERLTAEMAAMRADMKGLRAEMKDLRAEWKGDLASLEARMTGLEASVHADIRTLWVTTVGAIVTIVVAFIGTTAALVAQV